MPPDQPIGLIQKIIEIERFEDGGNVSGHVLVMPQGGLIIDDQNPACHFCQSVEQSRELIEYARQPLKRLEAPELSRRLPPK